LSKRQNVTHSIFIDIIYQQCALWLRNKGDVAGIIVLNYVSKMSCSNSEENG